MHSPMLAWHVAGMLLALASVVLGKNVTMKEYNWLDQEPSKHLDFRDCFGKYQCARLEVPMDYNRTDGNGSRVAVAIIKLPAKVPVTDPRYGGAILLNPGGPGGSGVSFQFTHGEVIQKIVDATTDTDLTVDSGDAKYFDVIGFDPRGVNNTTPQVICFPDYESQKSWVTSMSAEGSIGNSGLAFATTWARLLAVSESCTQRMNSTTVGDNLLEHVNTAPVVGDMVSIVEALGEWRESEALQILNGPNNNQHVVTHQSLIAPWRYWSQRSQNVLKMSELVASRERIIERTKWKKGQEKLLYWGFSYGSVLGATFAAMQPHRVGRVIIDGVVDSEDYYSAEFKLNLNDADYVFSQFFEFCASAGPSACAFAENEMESAADLRRKFDVLLASLIAQPIAVYIDESRPFAGPDIVTSSDLLRRTRSALYSPLRAWPRLATVFHDLQYRNGTSLSIMKNEDSAEKDMSCAACEDPYSFTCQGPTLGRDPELPSSVWCSDGKPVDITPEEFANTTLKTLTQQSPLFGDIWAALRMGCVGWKVTPKWSYNGIFKNITTSHPVFLIGTTGDPVCPMINAHKMATSFIGSVAMEQKSQGHCSISSPSLCTASYVRLYFQTGELPHAGTKCGVDQLPFGPSIDISASSWNAEERELWNVVKDFDGLF